MRITVRLFGPAVDIAGTPKIIVELPNVATAEMVKEAVFEMVPRLKEFGKGIAVAVDRRYASPDMSINEASEVALIPPVGGG